MRFARLSAVALSVLALAVPAQLSGRAGAAPARPESAFAHHETLRIIQDNIGHGSECDKRNTGTPNCLKFVDAQTKNWPADLVSVDEACQRDPLKFYNAQKGWNTYYIGDNTTDIGACGRNPSRTGQSKGSFVGAKGSITRKNPADFDSVHGDPLTSAPKANGAKPSDRTHLTCLRTHSFAENVWFCTVHLPYQSYTLARRYPNVHRYELEEIVRDINTLPGPAILAGDFNMIPSNPAFDKLRQAGFLETDPDNKPTTNARKHGGPRTKFDYVWYHVNPHDKRDKFGSSPSAQVGTQQTYPTFDHDMLKATDTLYYK